MPTLYSACKRLYRGMLPHYVRHAMYQVSPTRVKVIRKRLIGLLERTAAHDDIYDHYYYQTLVEPTMHRSANIIADAILAGFRPSTVVDVGCGTGLLMSALAERHVAVTGLEYSTAALTICRERGLNVRLFDIENDDPPELQADLCVSTEVAEHLPEKCA